MRTHLTVVLASGLVGAAATHWLFYRFLPPSEIFHWSMVDLVWLIPGAIAGGLSAHLLAVIARPRRWVSAGAVVCVAANAAVWLAFLCTAPLSQAEFQRIDARRQEADSTGGLVNFATDQPTVVAGRWHGTYGVINFADGFLTMSAGPAIGFANTIVVPARYDGEATKRESFAIAGLALFLSTAFWTAAGGLATSAMQSLRRRSAQPKEPPGATTPLLTDRRAPGGDGASDARHSRA